MSPLDRELERALARRAGEAGPPADLYAGVERTAGRIRRRRQTTVGAVALSVVALAVAVPLALGGDDRRDDGFVQVPTPTPTATTTVETPAPTPLPTPTPSPTASAPVVPVGESFVYFARDTERGPRLYREVHPGDDTYGVRTMLAGRPTDPDYRTLWPTGTTVHGVTVAGELATVDLGGEVRRNSVGSEFAEVAVQQLVYTVTANENTVKRVRILVDGERVDELWGSVDTSEPIARAPQMNVLAAVWLLTPTQGATVGRTFTLSGTATVFEATVHWDVRDASTGAVVRSGFATADNGAPARGEFTTRVTIPANVPSGTDLVVRAFSASAEDGSEQFLDTKAVTLGG